MTIILPPDYHAQKALENNYVLCVPEEQAQKEDIRPLRIGILNIMPEAKSYEFNLLHPLGRSVLQIIPVWIKLKSHSYKSTSRSHLNKLYVTFEEAIKQGPIDGMILTGAPVGLLEYHQIKYWDEIKELLLFCKDRIPNTLGICWGGLALAYLLGIKKEKYPKKLFGVFETCNLNRDHPITGGLDDLFWLPQSRYSGISDQQIELARDQGKINLLAHSKNGGYTIFESYDHRYLMNLGHFEYNAHRIVEEAIRDKNKNDVPPPANFDIDKPLNRWRGQRNEFFSQWVKYCHTKKNKEIHNTHKKNYIP